MSPAKQNDMIQCDDSFFWIVCGFFSYIFPRYIYFFISFLLHSSALASVEWCKKIVIYDRIIPLLLIWVFSYEQKNATRMRKCLMHSHIDQWLNDSNDFIASYLTFRRNVFFLFSLFSICYLSSQLCVREGDISVRKMANCKDDFN